MLEGIHIITTKSGVGNKSPIQRKARVSVQPLLGSYMLSFSPSDLEKVLQLN